MTRTDNRTTATAKSNVARTKGHVRYGAEGPLVTDHLEQDERRALAQLRASLPRA